MTVNQERLLKLVDKMPAFPSSAHRIIELTNNVNCAPKDLVKVIEHDPILTLNVLKLVNSAYFGLAAKVTSVKHAVVYLGINTVKNLALSIAAIGALPSKNGLGFNMSNFWWHSLVCAGAARIIATHKKLGDTVAGNCFVAGLVHDIGKIMFVHFLPDEYQKCICEFQESGKSPSIIETELIGASHGELGGMLAERWQLPPVLVTIIRNHHNLSTSAQPSDMDYALFWGNQLSKHLAKFPAQMAIPEEAPQSFADWIAMPLGEIAEELPEIKKEVERAEVMIQLV